MLNKLVEPGKWYCQDTNSSKSEWNKKKKRKIL